MSFHAGGDSRRSFVISHFCLPCGNEDFERKTEPLPSLPSREGLTNLLELLAAKFNDLKNKVKNRVNVYAFTLYLCVEKCSEMPKTCVEKCSGMAKPCAEKCSEVAKSCVEKCSELLFLCVEKCIFAAVLCVEKCNCHGENSAKTACGMEE